MNTPDESLIYADTEPDIGALATAYDSAVSENGAYFDACRQSSDDRRNIWPGKSPDLRKGGANAFPWAGASDTEVNVVGERIDTYVALFDQALQRSHIKAFATSTATLAHASVVSQFLKWMRSSYIPDFKGQMELAGNYLLEKGIMATYVGWKRESRTFLQTVTLDEIAAMAPELVEMILAGQDDDTIAGLIQQSFPAVSDKRAKKAVKDLRTKGEAEISVPRVSVDCPVVHACDPSGEVFFPPWVTDPQRSPYFFWRTPLTAQELEKKVTTEGWDRKWVDYAISNLVGKDTDQVTASQTNQRSNLPDSCEVAYVVYAYQRLIDEDGSEGIYCTVFHPDAKDAGHGYASHELMNGYDDYPIVVTRLGRDQKRLYEVNPMSATLRGPQMQIKTERDSRIDRASMATLPPLMHPAGRPPSDWGPGRRVPYRRLGEIAFGPIPPMDSGSIEVEVSMRQQADRAVGLDFDSPVASARQQYYIGKFLDHVKDVLTMAFKLYQRVGPDEVFFQVSGSANPQVIQKGDPDDNYSVVVSFDSMMSDPETAEAQLKQIVSLLQLDRSGRINVDALVEITANAISPVLADAVLQPTEVAADKMQKDVTDDLTKIAAAIEVPARPNGAQMALQIIQAYAQQPDVAARLAQDEAFAERLTKYAGQYQFTIQQQQNAEIGRVGTDPASMSGMQTQQMQQ